MYNHIKGLLTAKSPAHAVVEAAGVGYYVRIPSGTYRKLPQPGRQCFLHLSLVVREDALELYGFASEEEKRAFSELTRVNGVGPQSALSILSTLEVKDFLQAVEAGDAAAISRARGIGKKLAQRIILELKGALVSEQPSGPGAPLVPEAAEALIALGYTRKEALSRIEKVFARSETPATVEDLVRLSLQVGLKKS